MNSNPTVDAALQAIRERSYAGRHPELGKMIKCQVCGLRHRQNEPVCAQKIVIAMKPGKLDKGTNLLGEIRTPWNPARHTLGAAFFAKKRINKHPSKRQFQLIRLVRQLMKDIVEPTQEEVQDAKELAREILGWNKKKTYGTWMPRREENDSSSR